MFTPPGEARAFSSDRLWSRFKINVSFCLLKKDGFYTQVETPSDEDVAAADLAYLGGHAYYVSDLEAADLTAAGYADFLSLPPSTGDGYGIGTYGLGAYGEGTPPTVGGDSGIPYGSGPYGTGTYDGQ